MDEESPLAVADQTADTSCRKFKMVSTRVYTPAEILKKMSKFLEIYVVKCQVSLLFIVHVF
jgi:hypothetical protein